MTEESKLKMHRRGFLKVTGIGTAASLLAACGPKLTAPAVISPEPKSLTMLVHSGANLVSFGNIGKRFEEKTGITLDIVEVPFVELKSKLMAELLAGTGKYDLAAITNAMLWPAASYLEDVTAIYTDELIEDLPPAVVEHSRDLDGVLRGIAFNAVVPANYYRTDLFEERNLQPPTTWDEYVEVCKATTIEASGDQPKIWGSLVEASSKAVQPAVLLVGWFYQNGGRIADENMKPTFNLDANVEALQFVVDLIHKHKVAPLESSEMIYEDVHNMFLQGRGATAINWAYMVSMAMGDESEVKGKFAVAPCPAGIKQGVNLDNWCVVVPQASKNKDAAKEYLPEILTREGQMDIFRAEGCMARLSMIDPNDPEVSEANPFMTAWIEQMKCGVPQPKWENLDEAWMCLSAAMNAATTLSLTPKEALDRAQEEITELVT